MFGLGVGIRNERVLNRGKGECTSVFKWKGITLKEFDFDIF